MIKVVIVDQVTGSVFRHEFTLEEFVSYLLGNVDHLKLADAGTFTVIRIPEDSEI
jgi:hypothetical protein